MREAAPVLEDGGGWGEWINARGARSAPVGMGVTGRAPTRSLSHKSVKHSPIGYS